MKKPELLLSLALVTALSGCSFAPAYKPPATPAASTYQNQGPWVSAEPSDQASRGDWWQSYGDATLNQLETQLLANNTTLAAAVANYQQYQAYSAEANSALFPHLGFSGNGLRERESDHVPPLRNAAAPADYDAYTVGVNASYEVDLWGSVRNSVAAGRDAMQAAQADLASVQLSMQAQLADSYVLLRGDDQQLQLLAQTIDAYQKALELTQRLHNGGIVSGLDVARAQTQLSDAHSQFEQTQAQRAVVQDQIAALIGQNAASYSLPANTQPIGLPVVPLALPSSLLQRRPDVAAAERRVAAATASIGVAKAAWFPSLNLTASGGFQSTAWGNLFTAPDRIWSLGPALAFDLFDGGYRKATIKAAQAKADQAGADYRGVVLGAFQQVQDNLAALDHLGNADSNQKTAADAAQHAVDLSMDQYRHGAVSYLDVTTAQTTALVEKRGLLQLDTQRLRASVQLIRALGGGWSTAQLASK